MCGIIAHLRFNSRQPIDALQFESLNNLLSHRGPDDGGVFVQPQVALGMRRLCILDVRGGHQPMTSTDGRFVIVFNGEIYNFKEIRQKLEADGHAFKTQCDTEVLLHAYMAWKEKALLELNGMFAFCIWDNKEQELFMARDHMGIKPLYYAINSQDFMLASELKPIVRSEIFDLMLDHQAISDYLAYWYICQPQTIYKNVFQLHPGHWAKIKQGRMVQERYWAIPKQAETPFKKDEAIENLDHLVRQAVKAQMVSDVPLGTFLSGGIDSGLVSALAAKETKGKIVSFAMSFSDPSYDEFPQAKLSATHIGAAIQQCEMPPVTPALIQEIASAFDEPLGNASYVPTYILAKAARSKLKVVLTGDGGDELFGGYPTYQAPYYRGLWQRLPSGIRQVVRKAIAQMPVSHRRISLDYRLKQLMQGIDSNEALGHYTWRVIATAAAQEKLWNQEAFRGLNGYDAFAHAQRFYEESRQLAPINRFMYVDLNTFLLNDHLRKVDRMSMAHGLEARVPLLDYRIVEFAMRLSPEHKVSMRKTKIILKNVASQYLPASIIRGKKKGLTSPIAGWLDGPLKSYLHDMLSGGIADELFDRQEINRLCQEHWSKQKDNSRLLWALLTLQIWHQSMKGSYEFTSEKLA